jgi:Arc/MetJ-type ribon-helix-helix transcriptional regulator
MLEIIMPKRTVWHLEVSPQLNKKLENFIPKDVYRTKSEFIRAAVRDRLQSKMKKSGI